MGNFHVEKALFEPRSCYSIQGFPLETYKFVNLSHLPSTAPHARYGIQLRARTHALLLFRDARGAHTNSSLSENTGVVFQQTGEVAKAPAHEPAQARSRSAAVSEQLATVIAGGPIPRTASHAAAR